LWIFLIGIPSPSVTSGSFTIAINTPKYPQPDPYSSPWLE
jgi:hypothetical protein